MKLVQWVAGAFVCAMCMGGCSEDDVPSSPYLPTSNGQTWQYANDYSIDISDNSSGQESLTVATVSRDEVTFENEVERGVVEGVFTRSLAHGSLRYEDQKLLFSGRLALVSINSKTHAALPIEDLVLLDETIDKETIIDARSQQTTAQKNFKVVIAGTLTSTYDLTVTQTPHPSYTLDGVAYEDVMQTTVALDDVRIAFSSSGLGEAFITEADGASTVESTFYFARDVGMIEGETETVLPFRPVGEIVEEFIGEPMDSEALVAAGAPDLKPMQATHHQVLQPD